MVTPRTSSLAWLLLLFAACGGEQQDADAAPQARLQSTPLADIGYAGYAADDEESAGGVTTRDPLRSAPGFTLISNARGADLVDALGEVVQSWADPQAESWWSAELLPDGEVLAVGVWAAPARKGPPKPYLVRVARDGVVRWRQRLAGAHHAARTLRDGRLAVLRTVGRREDTFHPGFRFRDDLLVFLSAQGETLEEHSLFDMLRATEGFTFQGSGTEPAWQRDGVEPFHSNAIAFCDDEALHGTHPAFAPSAALVTIRHQDVVAVFDTDLGRAVWVWGRGELLGPHDAQFLPSGNVLVFDNGRDHSRSGGGDRGYSRVLEVDPRTDEIVWSYTAPEPSEFYTDARGSAQRLPGGTTLIGNSNAGEVFEVTPSGEVVWRYLNRRTDAAGRRALFFRARRYSAAFIASWLGK